MSSFGHLFIDRRSQFGRARAQLEPSLSRIYWSLSVRLDLHIHLSLRTACAQFRCLRNSWPLYCLSSKIAPECLPNIGAARSPSFLFRSTRLFPYLASSNITRLHEA